MGCKWILHLLALFRALLVIFKEFSIAVAPSWMVLDGFGMCLSLWCCRNGFVRMVLLCFWMVLDFFSMAIVLIQKQS